LGDNDGKTSLDLSKDSNHGDVVKLLQDSLDGKVFNYSICFKQISYPFKRRETACSIGDKAWRDSGGYKNRY
jgi:hypothetical protein